MNHDGKIGKTADQQSQDLTGSSIVAGHFFQLKEYHYAISSPNVDDNHGKVFLLHTFEKNDSKSIALEIEDVCSGSILSLDKIFSCSWPPFPCSPLATTLEATQRYSQVAVPSTYLLFHQDPMQVTP